VAPTPLSDYGLLYERSDVIPKKAVPAGGRPWGGGSLSGLRRRGVGVAGLPEE